MVSSKNQIFFRGDDLTLVILKNFTGIFLVAFSFFNQSGFGKLLMDKIILSSTNSLMEILYIWIINDY